MVLLMLFAGISILNYMAKLSRKHFFGIYTPPDVTCWVHVTSL